MRTISERDDWYFRRKVKEKFGDEYTIIGNYQGIHKKILIQHNNIICNNHQFYMRPHELLNGQKCPYCQKKVAKTTEDLKREIRIKFHNKMSLVSEYNGPRKKILLRCNSCGRVISIYPYELDQFAIEPCFCEKVRTEKSFISEVFKIMEIPFKENYKFSNSSFGIGETFDYAIPFLDELILIDYYDKSHFQKIYNDEDRFLEVKSWDQAKSEFLKLNEFYYFHINYWNFSNIVDIAAKLKKFLSEKKLNRKRFESFKRSLFLGSYASIKKKLE